MKLERVPVRVEPETSLEVLRLSGSGQGPVLSVLGGVHGDEPEGIVASLRLAHELQERDAVGTVLVLPIASPHAVKAGSRLSPVDGANLARCFPGSVRGTSTERIARAIDEQVIAGADLLIDLHSAGRDYHMAYFVGAVDDGSAKGRASVMAANAFGAPVVWRHERMNPGRSISAAWARGIPAVYAECGGGGGLRGTDVEDYVAGVLAVMSSLEMTASPPRKPLPERVIHGGDGDIDLGLVSPLEGWVSPLVEAGEDVVAAQPLLELTTTDGEHHEGPRAPSAGTVVMIRHRATVRAGEMVAVVAPPARSFPGDTPDAGRP